MLQQQIFVEPYDFRQFLPVVHPLDGDIPTYVWDIPYTITQLSYLTHSHYRYYGKFPSSVAALILDRHFAGEKNTCVYDHFCGSGTTLVEAKLRGIPSFGIDISWVSALVSNVKVRHIDLDLAGRLAEKVVATAKARRPKPPVPDAFAEKWFSPEAFESLHALRKTIAQTPASPERDFLLVGMLAIVRRVSKAFDGEVRPHINKAKRDREVFGAFEKKIREMLADHAAFQRITSASTTSICHHGDNSEAPSFGFQRKQVALVVSHPPYLNSFNYRPVFSLEFYWAAPFEAEYASDKEHHAVENELVAHPATEDNTSRYFDHLKTSYAVAHQLLQPGGKLAVVIGDCTRNGELIPVIATVIQICRSIGYELVEQNYRTTHYGLGKYAYKHRADYHGEDVEKKDGIIVFQKKA